MWLIKALIPFMIALPLWPHLILIISRKGYPSNTITLRGKISIYEFWGDINIWLITLYISLARKDFPLLMCLVFFCLLAFLATISPLWGSIQYKFNQSPCLSFKSFPFTFCASRQKYDLYLVNNSSFRFFFFFSKMQKKTLYLYF